MKKFKKLTDESLMEWGEYKDEELQEVPAKYLVWLEGEIRKEINPSPFKCGLLVYIDENRDVLEMEAKKQRYVKFK